jgi:CRISPR-associated protein Csm4
MNMLRVALGLRSALGTPLVADTLFGHLCWGLAYHEGDSAVRDFLAATAGPDPPLVISDPLPAKHWPMPVLPPLSHTARETLRTEYGAADRIEAWDHIREVLRRPWIPHAVWPDIAGNLDAFAVARALLSAQAPAPPSLVETTVAHNTIDRLSGRTLQEGGFFFSRQEFPGPEADFDVWVRSAYAPARVQQLFEWGLEGGYGRDAGTGLGQVAVGSVEPAELPPSERANAIMTLGACVPDATDPTRGFWNIDVRHGKLGGAWAHGQDEEAGTAFKHPVVFLARGAVLCTDDPHPVLGRVVANVHPTRPEVVTCGRTLAVPVRVTPEVLQCLSTE